MAQLTRLEAKSEVTTRVAWEIIEQEAASMAAKTERLRAARLKREASEGPVATMKRDRRPKGRVARLHSGNATTGQSIA